MKRLSPYLFHALLLSLLANPANAVEALPSASGSIVQMLLGLAVVIACLFVGLAALRRLQANRPAIAGALKVLGATSVGPRERVVLVSVGKQVLVLGVAPGRVTALHTLSQDEFPMAAEPTLVSNDFAARLRGFMERRRES